VFKSHTRRQQHSFGRTLPVKALLAFSEELSARSAKTYKAANRAINEAYQRICGTGTEKGIS